MEESSSRSFSLPIALLPSYLSLQFAPSLSTLCRHKTSVFSTLGLITLRQAGSELRFADAVWNTVCLRGVRRVHACEEMSAAASLTPSPWHAEMRMLSGDLPLPLQIAIATLACSTCSSGAGRREEGRTYLSPSRSVTFLLRTRGARRRRAPCPFHTPDQAGLLT